VRILLSIALVCGVLCVSSCGGNSPGAPPSARTADAQSRTIEIPDAKRATTRAQPADSNVIVNGGFETGELAPWVVAGTGRGLASVTSKRAHSGSYSAYMGTTTGPAVNGFVGIMQEVTIPSSGMLTMWVEGKSNDTQQYADQEADLVDGGGNIVFTCFSVLLNAYTWVQESCDVSQFAGQELYVAVGVRDNGYAYTYVNLYVDDVSLVGQGGPTPSPTPSSTPTPVSSASPTPSPTPPHPTPTPTALPTPTATPTGGTSPIQHVVIVLQENRTLENIFHGYPGANTVDSGKDHNGNTVPLVQGNLMQAWDPSHHYADWNTEYDNGGMNGFDLDGLDYGSGAPKDFAYMYAKQSQVQPYWDMATQGVLADEFFVDQRSESFPGHLYPIAGASGPVEPSEPDYYASEDPSDGTCDHPGSAAAVNIVTGVENGTFTSCFDFQTMADLLVAKGKTWRYYIDAASKDTSYVSAYATIKHIRNTPSQWANVVTPATQIYTDAANGALANVSWVIGTFADSDHSGQSVPSKNGPNWVASVMNAVGESKSWGSTVVILTYDDWGGWYDETPPPAQFNAFDPGFRVPFVAVSPYAKRGYISHNVHYIGSILHYIESNFGLGSLGTADATADALNDVFNYSQPPLSYIPVKTEVSRAMYFNRPSKVPQGIERD